MNKRFLAIIALTFLSITIFGSPIKLKGIIKDSQNGNPIPFANIAIIEIEKGTTSDYNGLFELVIDSSDLQSTLNISCLNYEDRQLNITELTIGSINEISVKNRTYEIPEIIVTNQKKKKEKLELNKLKKSEINGLLTCDNLPKMYARFFPYEPRFDKCKNISYLNIGFKGSQKVGNSKVRIRLLTNDTENNRPDNDILLEDLIILAKPGVNKIDISSFNIKIPKEGVFVAVEWLIIKENSFDWVTYNKLKIRKTETLYGPILGANYHQESFTWLYWAGSWEKYESKVPMVHPKIKAGSYFDSAISLTLTN